MLHSSSLPRWTRYVRPLSRGITSTARKGAVAAPSRTKQAGASIEDAFNFDQARPTLPQMYADLKKEIASRHGAEKIVESWRSVLKELDGGMEEIATRGSDNVPQVDYQSFVNGLSKAEVDSIKRAGVVVVKGGIPKEEALRWKQEVRDYAALNKEYLKGSPADNIVFYEIYNSHAQLAARSHPAVLNTQRTLLSLWHTRGAADAQVSVTTPISYFDRLRIRPPGPSAFVLGCHVDGGCLERWEDEGYRKCFEAVFKGNDEWKDKDWLFDVGLRVDANMDLHGAPSQCSVLRPWQGWTSISSTGPNEGTLRVLPSLNNAAAYLILRPFFRLRSEAARRVGESPESIPLGFNDWELNLDGTEFPGSETKAQVLTEWTHPHLRLQKSVVSVPKVEPGDQVYWHCDLVHAVESEHHGPGDSSVFYIPAVPMTVRNGGYLRAQRLTLEQGLPPPDFAGAEGEARFAGRPTLADVEKMSVEARRVFGVEPYETDKLQGGPKAAVEQANLIIF
ncbi:DUF1479-domain-containing protein [Trametopsis cervina]|nr:DUF1479-domain-containing protein [Trametopsis cervina]